MPIKKLLLIVILASQVLSGLAQDRVVLLRDTARLGISLTDLEKAYPPAFAREVGEKGIFERQGKLFYDSAHAYSRRLINHLDANKRRLSIPGLYVQTREFVRSDGTFDRVLCAFSGVVLTTEQEIQVLQLVAEWYNQHPFPVQTRTGFRWESFFGFGSVPEKRTVRRGSGIIATLDAAEKTTRPDTVKTLAFNRLGLRTVPEVVYRFPNLEELDLSKNALNELPARLTADIPSLRRLSLLYNAIPNDSVFVTPNKHLLALNLQGNKLTRVPKQVRNNRRLESLWLGNNQLAEIDIRTLRRLRHLNDLNLYNAGLKTLPKGLGKLKRLIVLDLYHNRLTELPRQLSRLKQLEQLAIAHNDLSALPASLARLSRLQKLYAHHNRISQLPDTFYGLKQLRILDLGYNWVTVAPAVLASLPMLEELDLNNNNLQELSTELGGMTSLKKLYLRSNPVTRSDVTASPYAAVIRKLEANKTEVFY